VYSDDSPTSVGPSGTTNQFGSQAEEAWNSGFIGSARYKNVATPKRCEIRARGPRVERFVSPLWKPSIAGTVRLRLRIPTKLGVADEFELGQAALRWLATLLQWNLLTPPFVCIG